MDGAILPVNFYCRSARLCLKRAALSKKSQLYAEELQHLKAFETLVISTIPGHPQYSAKKEEKSIVEIRSHLHDAKKRIAEIEGCNKNTNREPTTVSNLKGAPPGKADSKFLQRNNRASKRVPKLGGRPSGASETSPTRFKPTGNRSRSEPNTPLKSHSQRSCKPETQRTPPKSPNKIRALTRKLSEESTSDKANQDRGSCTMQDAYAFGSRSAPTSRKTTPISQRLKSVTECLGGDSPRKPKEREKLLAKVESLSRETSPFRDRTSREMPRIDSLGLFSSHSAKPIIRPTTPALSRFDSAINLGSQLVSSCDEAEILISRKTVGRLSPGVVHVSEFVDADSTGKEAQKKDSSKGIYSLLTKSSPPHYSSRHAPEERKAKEELSDQSERRRSNSPRRRSYIAEMNRGEEAGPREVDHGSHSQRRDEAAWTALRLQEQFGEALKELGGLQDRDTTGGLNMPDKSFLHGAGGVANSQEIGSPDQEGCRNSPYNGKADKMQNGLKSTGLHDLTGGEVYYRHRERECNTEYLNGDSERSGGNSPEKPSDPRKRTKPKELSNGGHDVGEEHPSFASRPHSRTGSEKSDLKNNLRGVREDCARFRVQMKVLKDLAEDSRIREFALHHQKEPVAKRRFDGEHADSRGTSKRGVKSRKSGSGDGKRASDGGNESDRGDSGVDERRHSNCSSRRRASSRTKPHQSPQANRQHSKNKNKARNISSQNVTPPLSITSPASSSSSSSSSSLSSLPLSHYIQKLRHLAPDSRFLPSPPMRSSHLSTDSINPAKGSSKFPQSNSVKDQKYHHHHLDADNGKAVETEYEGRHATSPAAILLPKSPRSSHTLSARIQQRIGHLYKKSEGESGPGKHTDSDQRLDAVLGGCALVASHLHRQISPDRGSRKERTHRSPKTLRSSREGPVVGHDCSLTFVGQKRHEKHTEASDGSIAGLHRLVGELKGSVEGVRIRIEVESEVWRSRVEGLEKEIETLKDETDDGVKELKKCITHEVKTRMGELTAEVERMRKDEKEKVDNIMQARADCQSDVNNSAIVDLKKQVRSLWAEVEMLTKEREDMKQHIDRLAHNGEEAKENTGREIRTLRRELRIDEDQGDTKKEADERAELKQALKKIKEEGLELKMEVNALKRGEKGTKGELENVKKLLEKIQVETEEMERDRGAAQMEGVRERLLIMERVESLSQLYLGGLEEVRTDVYNVKFHCRDRMDELESQWGEYKRQRQLGPDEDHSCAEKRLLQEMDHFRSEVANIMQTERGLLREALEREHECIRRQIMEIVNSNKNELSCMIKVEMQKRNQAVAKDKLTCLPEPMKRDMDRLKLDFEDAQHNAEAIAQIRTIVEGERDIAAQAAADASSAAAKAGEVLSELLGQFSSEMATTRRKSLALQDSISLEKDAALHAVAEAKRKIEEFQEFLLQEKTRLRNAVAMMQHERDAAASAASDASNSAIKAGEVLAEMLGSFNQEMNKARRKSSQLQEGLDRERENLEHDRDDVIKKSHEAQNRFSEELEKAITTWKRAMDQEVGKAKQITAGLEEERQRLSQNREQLDMHVKGDVEHLQKTDDALSKLHLAVKNLEESAKISQEEKHRRRLSKQDTKAKTEQDQKIEYNKLKEKIDEALRREQAMRDLVDESAIRVKKLEGLHIDLLQSFQEIRASTGDLEETASIWLPKYESAARIVHEINCKVDKLEEKCNAMSGDEGLKQTMSHVSDSNLQSLKDIVAGGADLKDLFIKVENGDRAQRQALSLLDARVSQLESVVGNGGEGLSLKLEYIENRADLTSSVPNNVVGLTQTVEALRRKVEVLTAPKMTEDEKTTLATSDGGLDVNSKLSSLESRIELVASATFTNLRLLDAKVEECSTNAQQALEGAATAENKCSALGVELVKVFRMLASSRQASPAVAQRSKSPPTCGRDHSPSKSQPARSPGPSPARIRSGLSPPRPSPPRNRSALQRGLQVPKPVCRRGTPAKPRGSAHFTRSTLASEMRKVTTRSEQVETEEEYILLGEQADPGQDRLESKDQRFQMRDNETVTQALCVHEEQPSGKVAQEITSERTTSIQEAEIKGLGRLTISQDRVDDKHKEGGNKCQRTNIRLEAGRIHVNVSHRSGAHGNRDRKSGTDQKSDLVAV